MSLLKMLKAIKDNPEDLSTLPEIIEKVGEMEKTLGENEETIGRLHELKNKYLKMIPVKDELEETQAKSKGEEMPDIDQAINEIIRGDE